MTICQELAEAFPEHAAEFTERERIGLERYGQPVDPIGDPRDWDREASEELLDAMVYVTAQLHRLCDAKRVDPDARHRYLVLREVRRTLATCLSEVKQR